jgi:hypothetical protein
LNIKTKLRRARTRLRRAIPRLTRAELEALAFVGLLALLSAIPSLRNGPAGVDRDLSAMASHRVTTGSVGTVKVNW